MRQEILGGPMIRLACGADLAAAPGERGGPLHAVIPVDGLMDERIILALRGIAPTRILDDDDVTSRHKIIDVM